MLPSTPLSIGILQASRKSYWRDSLSHIINLLESQKSSVLDKVDVLFLAENWLMKNPLFLEDYLYAIETVSKYIPNVFGGTSYVIVDDSIISMGYSIINGKAVKACEKIFPSKAVGERELITSGSYVRPISFSSWKIGCIACVDIFYPEVSRLHVVNGAHLIYNPAAIPNDRIPLWHSVLEVRAVENTVFSLGVNGVGYIYPDGRKTSGESIIYSPGGRVLAKHGENEGLIRTVLEPHLISSVRERWAFYEDLMNIFYNLYKEAGGSL